MRLETITTANRLNVILGENGRNTLDPALVKGEDIRFDKDTFKNKSVMCLAEIGSLDKLREIFSGVNIHSACEVKAYIFGDKPLSGEDLCAIEGMLPKADSEAIYMNLNRRLKPGVFEIILFFTVEGKPDIDIKGKIEYDEA